MISILWFLLAYSVGSCLFFCLVVFLASREQTAHGRGVVVMCGAVMSIWWPIGLIWLCCSYAAFLICRVLERAREARR